MASTIPYHKLPGLETLYLEDSYVLSIDEAADTFTIFLDCVLTEKDPDYHLPKAREHHCYRKLNLTFAPTREVIWLRKDFQWSTDASGEEDLGNIDTFEKHEDGIYELSGGWGVVRIEADAIKIIR